MQPIQPPVPSPPPPLLAQISPSVSGVNRLITKNRRNSKGMDGIWPFPTNSLRRYCPRLVKSVYYNAGTSLRIFGLHFFFSGSWRSVYEKKWMGRGRTLWETVTKRGAGETVLENPNSSKGFREALLKARKGRGLPGPAISSCTALWLADGVVTGLLG